MSDILITFEYFCDQCNNCSGFLWVHASVINIFSIRFSDKEHKKLLKISRILILIIYI